MAAHSLQRQHAHDRTHRRQESLAENPDYDIPRELPFKGEKWVEELEKVFDRLQEEWELKQLDAETADQDGPYHARAGNVSLHLSLVCWPATISASP